ncbi:spore gernimation protein GerPD [Camelliibacillus cellulosilyticus]|uniref:Spore gernimation protein GerPD n=1 Tax=Camelliibacillus cellulosilyticus TaxID=2174486 RepID=A0ABV9GJL3_9BACL
MNLTVINKNLKVDRVRIIGVAAGSVFIIGDAGCIGSSSIFDTPPESIIIGTQYVPIAPEGDR